MTSRQKIHSAAAVGTCLIASVLSIRSASASTILFETGSATVSPPAETLTTDGTVDWAIWNYSSGTTYSGAPTNTASGLTDIFSSVTSLSGAGIRGSSKVANESFTYTNGSTPGSQSNAQFSPVLDATLNTVGSGFTFTILGNPSTAETAKIYLSGSNTGANFTATLDGQMVTDNTVTYGSNNPISAAVYTITFKPNSSNDPLTIKYANSGTQGGFGYVGVEAVAVSQAITPEPASLGIFGIAAAVLLGRKRRNIHVA